MGPGERLSWAVTVVERAQGIVGAATGRRRRVGPSHSPRAKYHSAADETGLNDGGAIAALAHWLGVGCATDRAGQSARGL